MRLRTCLAPRQDPNHSSKDLGRGHADKWYQSTPPQLHQSRNRLPPPICLGPHHRPQDPCRLQARTLLFCLAHPHCHNQAGHPLFQVRGRALQSRPSRVRQDSSERRGHMTTCLAAGTAGAIAAEQGGPLVTGVLVRKPQGVQLQSKAQMRCLQLPDSQSAHHSRHSRPHQKRSYPLPRPGTLPLPPTPSPGPQLYHCPDRGPNPPSHSRLILRPWQRQPTGQARQSSSSPSHSRANRKGRARGLCGLTSGASSGGSRAPRAPPAQSKPRQAKLALLMKQALQKATGRAGAATRGGEAPRLPGTRRLQLLVTAVVQMLALLMGLVALKRDGLLLA